MHKYVRGLILTVIDQSVDPLPSSFGKRPRWRPAQFVEAYFDGLWYLAQILYVDDRVCVEYVGYATSRVVPFEWIRKTSRAPASTNPGVEAKFWRQRYALFSLYDLGIVMDTSAWYSVTPEAIARGVAERCRGRFVIDAFCGVGGNSIQFARVATVLAVDNDPVKIAAAKHNSRVYDVSLDFVVGDSLKLLHSMRADIVFLSPPWGGLSYLDTFRDISSVKVGDYDGVALARLALKAAPNLIFYLPRSVHEDHVRSFMKDLGLTSIEVESNVLNDKLKAKTLYVGPLFLNP